MERRLLGENFLLVQRIQFAASAEQSGGANRRRGDETTAKDGYHERSDQENQIKRKDVCQKSLVGLGVACEGLCMQKWYERLEHMKKKDEKGKMERMHQRKVEKMIKSAEGRAGLLHKITKPTMRRRGGQILKKEEDARLLDRCEAKRKNEQSIGNVMRKYNICRTSHGEMMS